MCERRKGEQERLVRDRKNRERRKGGKGGGKHSTAMHAARVL